jgi:hypothetical protein
MIHTLNAPWFAYFSMEVALKNHIPTYSGGLGVLARDTLRSAADLGLAMVGVTLLHLKGYFFQRFDAEGRQHEEPVARPIDDLLQVVDGAYVVEVEGRTVTVRAEATGDVVDMVRRVLRTARLSLPASRSLGDGELCRRVQLDEGDEMQKAISRRAFVYTAKLLSEVAMPLEGAMAWYAEARERMVQHQIVGRGVQNLAVLGAMRKVPREAFVPRHPARRAYTDEPLPIGGGQTISQPYIVAIMTEGPAPSPRGSSAGDRHGIRLRDRRPWRDR